MQAPSTMSTQSRCSMHSFLYWVMWETRAGNSMIKSMYINEIRCDGALTEIKIEHCVHSQEAKITSHPWS